MRALLWSFVCTYAPFPQAPRVKGVSAPQRLALLILAHHRATEDAKRTTFLSRHRGSSCLRSRSGKNTPILSQHRTRWLRHRSRCFNQEVREDREDTLSSSQQTNRLEPHQVTSSDCQMICFRHNCVVPSSSECNKTNC